MLACSVFTEQPSALSSPKEVFWLQKTIVCSGSQQPPLRHRAPGQPDDGQRVPGGRLQSRKTKHGAAGRHQDQGGYVSYRSYSSVGGGRRKRGGGGRERETHTHTHTHTQTHGQTERQTETDRRAVRQTERQVGRQTERCTGRQRGVLANKQTRRDT